MSADTTRQQVTRSRAPGRSTRDTGQFHIASQAPTFAGATTVPALQLDISLGPVLAGVAWNAGAGITSGTWIGAVLLGRAASHHRPRMAVNGIGSLG